MIELLYELVDAMVDAMGEPFTEHPDFDTDGICYKRVIGDKRYYIQVNSVGRVYMSWVDDIPLNNIKPLKLPDAFLPLPVIKNRRTTDGWFLALWEKVWPDTSS